MMTGDPRSFFYGDPIVIEEGDVAEAIGKEAAPVDAVPAAIVNASPTDVAAATKVAAYEAMSPEERAMITQLPPLACWNAFTTINPQIGRVLATSLNYMLLKSLNDYPFAGQTFYGTYADGQSTVTITWQAGVLDQFIAVPFFRFAIAASTLTARPGAQIQIDVIATDPQGNQINTVNSGYSYFLQRMNNTEAIIGVYIVNTVVATRTLPFLALAGGVNAQNVATMTIVFTGVAEDEQVSVTVPGYATPELREISKMYALPAGDVR